MAIEESNRARRKNRKNKNLEPTESSKNGRIARKAESESDSPSSATKHDESDEEASPRGVLEELVSSGCLTTMEVEKSLMERGFSGDLNNLQWKKMFGQVKKTSNVWKISTISLLGAGAQGLSKKALRKRMGRKSNSEDVVGDFIMPKPSWRNFTFEELRLATDGFSSDKMIGKGGHAEVYKGTLPDGQIVAVKKMLKEKKKDEDKNDEFLAELGIIAHIDHPNAAKLIGFSADQGLYLVLQYLPYGSLATALHGSADCNLEWKTRYKVAIGIAKGLQYLHSSCQRRIIHRDITASNILLSEDYEAQISDFGLAKWLPENWPHLVVSPIEGTFGYMAPEYFMHGLVNEKTDVFAFGVLLLELITGRRAVDSSSQSLVMWAKPHLENSKFDEIADPRLGGKYNVVEMKRAMFAASNCINQLPNMRPNMKRVVQLLKGDNGLDMKQKSMGERTLHVDACDMENYASRTLSMEACDVEDYTSATYLNEMNRHMQLVME